MKTGYFELGEAKGMCYIVISLAFVLLFLFSGILRYKRKKIRLRKKFSMTEFFLYASVFSGVLTLIYSVDKTTAFLGMDGWRCGFLTCMLAVFFAIMYSYFSQANLLVVLLVLLVPFAEFILCIIGRFGIYPFEIYGQASSFVATLGNINWYSGFLSVFVPLGVGIMYIKRPFSTYFYLGGIYTVTGLVALFLQGSDGAILILAATYIFLLISSLSDREYFKSFVLQLGVLGIAMTITDVLMLFFGAHYTYDANLLLGVCQRHIGEIILAASFFVYRINRLCEEIKVEWHKKAYTIAAVSMLLAAAAAGLVLVVINFDDSFGNGRGIIWQIGASMFLGLSPWQKVVGVGQDCFYSYAMSSTYWSELFSKLFGSNMLTNAHNELLTVLVERGILGALIHLGLFGSAVVELFKAKEKESIAIVYALPIISYFAFNLASFAQPTSTPYVYICIGFGIATIKNALKMSYQES